MALTQRQRAFVEEYLACWCGAEAARRAGYSARTVCVKACTLLKLPEVKEAIAARLTEKAMTADEVLLRLAEQARGEQAAYLRANGTVDLERLLADHKGHLVKATKWDRSGTLVVEFYDAQAALTQLGRHLALFTDNVNVTDTVEVTTRVVRVAEAAASDSADD